MRRPSDDEATLREACRDVLKKQVSSTNTRLVMESDRGFDADFWSLAAQLGWLGLGVAEAHGGLGGTVAMLAAVADEVAWSGQPSPLVATFAVAHTLSRYQSDAGMAILTAVMAGDAVLTWGGLGPDSPQPIHVVDGELRGSVELVPDGQCATHLAVGVIERGETVLALVDLSQAKRLLVPTLDLTRRYTRVILDGVPFRDVTPRLPARALRQLFDLAVVLQCAESTGVARRLLEMTVTYARQRVQFGAPIGSFQAIKHRIADMLIETEGCRVATLEAADALDADADADADTDLDPGSEAVSIAKSWVGRAASFVATHALQIHGGIGFSWEYDLHLYLRRAKANELLLGSPGWHDELLYRSLLETERR
jgi:alkylation response protein AidB-like acyl-CoA dehydrogenase